jgi:S1-C subfamily serine protease
MLMKKNLITALLVMSASSLQAQSATMPMYDPRDMLERVLPAVVSVGVAADIGFGLQSAFGFSERTPATERALQAYSQALDLTGLAGGSGSGFVIQRGNQRYVVTNAHVIAGAHPEGIYAFSISGKPYEMRIVGADTYRDVAVLRFVDPPGSEISTVTIHNADDLRVGTPVYAIGNPLGYLPYTITAGIIGAMNRMVTYAGAPSAGGFLQTDASILPGNSGGPLFGPQGTVVGMNSAGGTYRGQQTAQLNYAVEGRHLARFVNDIITHGRVQRGYLGIVVSEPFAGIDSVRIDAVLNSASPLAAYQNARLVSINGQPIHRLRDAYIMLEEQLPGKDVRFQLATSSGMREVTVRTELLTPERLANIGSWVINSQLRLTVQPTQSAEDGSNLNVLSAMSTSANVATYRFTGMEWALQSAFRMARAGDKIGLVGLKYRQIEKLYIGGTLQEVGVVARLTLPNGYFSYGYVSGEDLFINTARFRPMSIF